MAGLLPPVRDIGVPRDPVRSFLALLGVFCVLLLALALFERLGLQADQVPEAVLASAVALFGLVGLVAHGRRPADFYAADRNVRPVLGGTAAAAGLVGLLTIGLAGGVFRTASEMLVTAAGFVSGAFLLALVAPGLRSAGGTHFGDFLAARFGAAARLAGAAVAFGSSLLLLLAVLKTAGALVSALMGVVPEQGLYFAAGLCALGLLPGGMRSLTWTQMAQYLVTALACLAPVGLLIFGQEGGEAANPFRITDMQARIAELAQPFASATIAAIALPLLLLAIGTASLPQVLVRAFAAPSRRAATLSMLWAVLLAAILVGLGLLLGQLLLAPHNAMVSGEGPGDILTRAMPLLIALPPLLVGLVIAGLLAALLATGQAALFSAATALSRDIWDEVLDPRGPAGRRLLVARILLVLVAYGACWLALAWSIEAPALLGWAVALAAAGNFVPLMLGLYWRRCTPAGGAFGIASGFSVTSLVFLLDTGVMPAWRETDASPALGSTAAAALGLAAAILVSVAVSLLRPEPQRAMKTAEAGSRAPGDALARERPA
jgi:cation/acetate symporter